MGLWERSNLGFPSGFKNFLNTLHQKGLVLGLWFEPEVIGLRSVLANQLPEEVFFQDKDRRVVEKDGYQLDFWHPLVCKRMDRVIDHLIDDYGVGYFKFDYNIEVIQGTDANEPRKGIAASTLEHNRAYLNWVHGIYDQHPDLVIESCSSGTQKMDHAMLSVRSLQSTSD